MYEVSLIDLMIRREVVELRSSSAYIFLVDLVFHTMSPKSQTAQPEETILFSAKLQPSINAYIAYLFKLFL